MKKSTFFAILMIFTTAVFAQLNPRGAWVKDTSEVKEILLFQDGYFTSTNYQGKEFGGSWGGPFSIIGNKIRVSVEFNSNDKEQVGTIVDLPYTVAKNKLTVQGQTYNLVDNSNAPLAGVWKITDRMQEGKLVAIHRTGPRKTLKMLTGTRFQWFAINPDTKEFSGTGGGTYTFKDGKYIENIDFFSRDSSRIGAKLEFDGKLENGKWHHSGLSSRGDRIYEVWGREESR